MLSWTLRTVGFLLILPSLIYQTFLDWFPGLPEEGNWYFLGGGIMLYIAGALMHFFDRRKGDSDFEIE